MGADDYSESLAVNDGPVQVAFTVSEDRVVKTMFPIYY
jgi:hypothetical protein